MNDGKQNPRHRARCHGAVAVGKTLHCGPRKVSSQELLDDATRYAQLGWRVFPLRGKVPAIPKGKPGGDGYLSATTVPGLIRKWWEEHPDANVGVSCIGSGFIAVDIDPRDGGDQTWADVVYDRELPGTPVQFTGGGGTHILFNTPEGQLRGSLGPGVQIKHRGYIVCSPSIHPDTGRQYRWNHNHSPFFSDIAEAPDWLIGAITVVSIPSHNDTGPARPYVEEGTGWGPKPAYSRAALRSACHAIGQAPWGEQEKTLAREAFSIGTLVSAGLMPRQLAVDCLYYSGTTMTNRPGDRPWVEQEIREKVERRIEAGERFPRRVA